MDRIEFIKKASKYFDTPIDNDYQGLMRFDIKGQEAENLRIINKYTDRKNNSPKKEMFLINNDKIKNFLKENNLLLNMNKLKGNIYIKSRQDDCAFEDYNELIFNIVFNIDQLYDALNLAELEKELVDIYRVENKNGEGIYKSGFTIKSKKSEENPPPNFDDNIKQIFTLRRSSQEVYENGYRYNWYFGFQDKKKITNWFHVKEDIENFINEDVIVTHYRVPKKYTVESKKQIIFKKDKAMKFNSVLLKDYLDSLKMKEFLESKEIKKEGLPVEKPKPKIKP